MAYRFRDPVFAGASESSHRIRQLAKRASLFSCELAAAIETVTPFGLSCRFELTLHTHELFGIANQSLPETRKGAAGFYLRPLRLATLLALTRH